MADQPYDPYIPAGGNNGSASQGGNSRTAALQAVGSFILSVVDRASTELSLYSRSNGMRMGRVLKHRRLGDQHNESTRASLASVEVQSEASTPYVRQEKEQRGLVAKQSSC